MMYLTHFARITHVSFPEVGPWFCNWYFVVNNWYLACEFSILQRVSKFLGSVFSTLGGGGGGGGGGWLLAIWVDFLHFHSLLERPKKLFLSLHISRIVVKHIK